MKKKRQYQNRKILWLGMLIVMVLGFCTMTMDSSAVEVASNSIEKQIALNIVSVEVTGENGEVSEPLIQKEYEYYQSSQKVVVTIAPLEETVKQELPVLTVNRRTYDADGQKTPFQKVQDLSTSVWHRLENSNYWQAVVTLPSKQDQEIEYQLTLEARRENIRYQLTGDFVKNGEFQSRIFVMDRSAPELKIVYSVDNRANYWQWGYLFSKQPVKLKFTAKDQSSGISEIRLLIEEKDGKKVIRTKQFQPSEKADYELTIPLSGTDFYGTVTAEITDYCGNVRREKRTHLVESLKKHQETGKAKIQTLTIPGRTVNGVDYYNKDVEIRLELEDNWSGIGSWEYRVNGQIQEWENYKAAAGTDFTKEPEQTIHHKMQKTVTLDAKANEQKETLVELQGSDNAGYDLLDQKTYHIDVTKPVITVEYDQNEPFNEKYYSEARTAVVKITECNFDPSDVEFLITSTDGSYPKIGTWSSSGTGDSITHECTVVFDEDDEYTFSVKFMDLAGNNADYDRIDHFVIDRTAPKVMVTYDDHECQNECYYREGRMALLEIRERNFDPEAVEIVYSRDGEKMVPQMTGWVQMEEFCYRTQISFLEDGVYDFEVFVKDLAMNESEHDFADHFVIDQTSPDLKIIGIEHKSANRGEVKPEILCKDINFDKTSVKLTLFGASQGNVAIQGKRAEHSDGFTFSMEDFPYKKEKDDLYTLKAEACDLAGNKSTLEMQFSVNRFGSVYTFDEETESFAGENGTYYLKEPKELVITETNVDTLEFQEIVKNLNGKLETLKEGSDFHVEVFGTETTWKQYVYTIYAKNFTEEGNYSLNIYSEDRAKNVSDNHTKGKEICFAIDQTAPTVVLTGIETGGQYRKDQQEFLVDVQDQGVIAEAVVSIDGVEQRFDMEEILKAEGRMYFQVPAAGHEQNIRVMVSDLAGNQTVKEIDHVQVHGNVLVLWYLNHKLFYGVMGAGIVLMMGVGWYWKRRKRSIKKKKS